MVGCALALAWTALYAGAAAKAIAGSRAYIWPDAVPRSSAARLADVVLVRPCAGRETGLAERLSQAGGAAHVVFALPSLADPALADVEAAAAALRAGGTHVHIVQMVTSGPNRKAEQMAAAVASLDPARDPHAPIVFADSDVDLSSFDLAALVQPLESHATGAVWAPPIEAGARRTDGDTRSHAVLGTTLHAFPLLAAIDPRGMVGKLFATTRASLSRIGGLDDLRLYIGEDMEFARRLRRAALVMVTAPQVAPSLASGRSTADVASRYLRWLQVIRAQRPALIVSYPLLLAAGPSFALLAALSALLHANVYLYAAFAGLLVRLAVAVAAKRATRSTLTWAALPFAASLGDFVLLSACARALVTRQVTWRGAVLTLGADGRLRA